MRDNLNTYIGIGLGVGCLMLVALIGAAWKDDPGTYLDPPLMDLWLEMAESDVTGYATERKFGFIEDVNSTWEVIAPMEAVLDLPTSAQELHVSSTSANDDGSGAGARTIQIIGLDSSLDSQSEVVSMTSDTFVATVGSYYRVNRAYVITTGTTDSNNAGDISIYTATDSDYVAMIPAGEGQTLQAIYTVPNGYTAYIRRVTLSAASNKVVDFRGRIRLNADDVTAPVSPFRTVFRHTGVSAPATFTGEVFNPFPGKTDMIFEAQGASNPAASVAWDIVLKED